MSARDAFKKVYLFEHLTDAQLDQLVLIAQEKLVHPGQDIFVAGQPAQDFYIVKSGAVKIYSTSKVGDDVELIELGSGFHFGEIPFVDGEKRSANASAKEMTTLIEISYEKIREMLSKDAQFRATIYQNLAKNLCGRLRATTQNLQFAREARLKNS